jgi:indole-3-glycerol phosphate synthase
MGPSLSQAIIGVRAAGGTAVVADIKPVSPRDGDLLRARAPAELARLLVQAGACALSVVTEARSFGGSCELLKEVAGAVCVPVLRKDFLTTREDLDSSREAGATAVLMIVATTPKERLAGLHAHAVSIGLEPVVEVHTREELELALELRPSIVGVNNRDITQLEKDPGDVATTEALAPLVPEDITILSESSLLTSAAVGRALAAGAHAVLIGTLLLKAPDPAAAMAQLLQVSP